MAKSLRTVTDRFSLVDLYRQHTTQNGRNYLIDAVASVITRPDTQERMKLGELYGYYGHGRREQHYNKTGSIRLPETSVIMVEGAPVIVDNVPSNRTVDISVSEDGIVTHTQEILDTPTGQIVDGMERSQAGGWSWATKGGTQGGRAIVREFAGFDFVTIPNFISLDRVATMFESGEAEEEAVVASLVANGMTQNAAVDVYQHFRRMREGQSLFEAAERATELELDFFALQGQMSSFEQRYKKEIQQLTERYQATSDQHTAMMESARGLRSHRRKAVRAMLERLPYHVTEEQRRALISMETPEDVDVVMALFESVSKSSVKDLPIGRHEPLPAAVTAAHYAYEDDPGCLEIVPRGGSARLQQKK
ncbi:TPA: head processing protein [Enterobacter hormaechei subsp. xiangfangensis]|nr:head processing protein [Enterobacter hormaechei subsp. xiangfangensis]HAV1890609.1 head processing protein [Enterobacter hormaechei subsp. xiangfangensis]